MSAKRILVLSLLLLLKAGSAAAQSNEPDGEVQDGAWMSYREAYKLMIRFEKYGKPKQFIQSHLQVVPRDKSVPMDGVRMTLIGRSAQLDIALDAAGRAVFPLQKSAYDDNARLVLVLNRKIGMYTFQPRISIAPRADGVYEATDLRIACEQVLTYLRYIGDSAVRDKKCAGVIFSYAKNAPDPVVRFRGVDHAQSRMRVEEGGAFHDDTTMTFKTVAYHFADWPERGQIVTQTAPVAIGAMLK
ncbi:MAG TPA: hypothetical protein VEC06_04030 [Paucimonas sp.]|nr:hypothetical protein [Paucimonas sp.]